MRLGFNFSIVSEPTALDIREQSSLGPFIPRFGYSVIVKPHLHEQVFFDNFSLRSLFCFSRFGLIEENDNFLLNKCTC